jgi:hypothetical protein
MGADISSILGGEEGSMKKESWKKPAFSFHQNQ